MMKILIEPFPHLIITDYYNAEEYDMIFSELEYYRIAKRLLSSDEVGGTICPNGSNLKKNRGLYLNDYYNTRDASPIIQHHKKLFSDDVAEELEGNHWFFDYLKDVDSMSTLVSYYGNGDFYKPHHDRAIITCITHMYKTPKKFSGGDLYFPDYDYTIPVENNRLILFPSSILHEAKQVTITEKDQQSGNARYTISLFLGLQI